MGASLGGNVMHAVQDGSSWFGFARYKSNIGRKRIIFTCLAFLCGTK